MYVPNIWPASLRPAQRGGLQLRWAGRRWLVCFGPSVLGFAKNYRGAKDLATRLQCHPTYLTAKGA